MSKIQIWIFISPPTPFLISSSHHRQDTKRPYLEPFFDNHGSHILERSYRYSMEPAVGIPSGVFPSLLPHGKEDSLPFKLMQTIVKSLDLPGVLALPDAVNVFTLFGEAMVLKFPVHPLGVVQGWGVADWFQVPGSRHIRLESTVTLESHHRRRREFGFRPDIPLPARSFSMCTQS
jgi:hypothetical protein